MSDNPDEFSRIASTIELSDGLALILAVGPDFRAPEGLSLIRSSLPASRPTLWHRLDRDGPDVVSAVERAQVDNPIVLVHGLENLEPEDRAATESSLNMLRDRLTLIRAAVIFWVPRSDLESFQRHCADLFAWRSLLVSLSEEQVPVDPDLEAQRIYLSRLRGELEQRLAATLSSLSVQPEILSDRMVLPKGAHGAVPLSDWVKKTQYGFLAGGAGYGTTTALRALVLLWAREAAGPSTDVPCPLLATARDIYRGPALGLDLDGDEMPVMPFPGARFATWAQAGELVLILDGLDEIEETACRLFTDWLERLRFRYPRLRMLVTAREPIKEFQSPWVQAQLEPLSFAQLRAHMGELLQPSQRPMLEAALSDLQAAQKTTTNAPPLPLPLLFRLIFDGGPGVVSSLAGTALLSTVASLLTPLVNPFINSWLGNIGRKPPKLWQSAPETVRWLLSFLAFHGLELETDEVPYKDISHAIQSMQRKSEFSIPNSPEDVALLLHEASRYLPWIIAETGPNRFRFTHPLFETFFAADWVANEEPGAAVQRLAPFLEQPRWRTVATMTAGQFARHKPQEAREFIEQLLNVSVTPDSAEMRRLALALDCALAARLPAQETLAWRTRAEQLRHSTPRTEEEKKAWKELRDALERLQRQQRSA